MTAPTKKLYDDIEVPPPKSLEPYFKDPEHWGIPDARWYKHQILGVRVMKKRRSVLLNDDMGVGKTMQVLATFCVDIKSGMNTRDGRKPRLVVVCPATVKTNWGYEIRKYTRLNHVVVTGSPTQREKCFDEFEKMADPKVLVINYEQVGKYLHKLNRYEFDMSAFDEAHMIKNPISVRGQGCRGLKARRSIPMTGTPLLHNVMDLWVLLDRCAPGAWGSYTQFEHRYAVIGADRSGKRRVVGVKREDELKERMSEFVLARRSEDVLDLPKIQFIRRMTEMYIPQRKMYNVIDSDMLAVYQNGVDVEAVTNASSRFTKLLQVCGTTKAVDKEGKDCSEKLDLVIDDACELLDDDKPVVIFTRWRGVHSAVVERLRKARDYPVYQLHGDIPEPRRQEIVDAWSSDSAGAIVCMYQVASVGLNMTHAAHMLRVDRTYTPAINQQAVKRIHRIGSDLTRPVKVFDYIVANSVEHRVEQIITSKEALAGKLTLSREQMMETVLEMNKLGVDYE